MSTRSGKRIHSSFHDSSDKVDKELIVMSERKSKSTRLKENQQDLGVTLFKSKKRNNYVTYPTDDENLVDTDTTCDTLVKTKRITRRNALKEQNMVAHQSENVENFNIVKKPVRVTRRTIKNVEGDIPNGEQSSNNHESVSVKKEKSKKDKKNKDLLVEEVNSVAEPTVMKNKSRRKKGKRSNYIISELTVSGEESLMENLNISTDSFHSAFDSSREKGGVSNKNKRNLSKNTQDNIKNDKNLEYFDTNKINTTSDADNSLSESTDSFVFRKGSDVNNILKNQNSSIENFLSIEQVSDKETLDSSKTTKTSIENETPEIQNITTTPESLKLNEQSLLKDLTNNKNKTPLKTMNTTFEMEGNLTLHLSGNKRKSGIVNTVFEKDTPQSQKSLDTSDINKSTTQNVVFNEDNLNTPNRLSVKLNSTFDKNGDTSKKFNSTFEIENKNCPLNSSNKKRQSTLVNTTFAEEVSSTLSPPEIMRKRSNSTQISTDREHTNSSFCNTLTLNNTFEFENPRELNTNCRSSLKTKILDVSSCSYKDPKTITTFGIDSNLSLISSDGSECQDVSRITITSDESINQDLNKTNDVLSNEIDDDSNIDVNKTSNDVSSNITIMNTTPYLIESSMDETIPDIGETLQKPSVTPLKREGTFTKIDETILGKYELQEKAVTPLKREGTFTSIDDTVLSKDKSKKKAVTPLKREGTFTSMDETVLSKDKSQKKVVTPLKREGTFTTIDETVLSKDESQKKALIPLKHDGTFTSIDETTLSKDKTKRKAMTPLKREGTFTTMDKAVSDKVETLTAEPVTPLRREGTFSKNGPDVLLSDPAMVNSPKVTPTKQMSYVGCTPFSVRTSSKGQFVLNVTRSLDKSRRSSLVEPVPRTARVMFCSPVNDPATVTQQKRKVIKSNLKGSNKSFIFQECESPLRAVPRKRSYTQNDVDYASAKRKRLTEDMQESVDRLSRPRTFSAAAKLTESTTPSKKDATPSKAKRGAKVSRTKLPNFAALHQKQFDKMESLDECQERKAKRARQLLTPTTTTTAKNSLIESVAEVQKIQKPSTAVAPYKPDFTSLIAASHQPGYTRFGFKLNLDVNPFSVPSEKRDTKLEESKAKCLTREVAMPSTAGATSLRRERAKQLVMREKSNMHKNDLKRNEARSYIKGVRTNRRFDLQMKLRNIE